VRTVHVAADPRVRSYGYDYGGRGTAGLQQYVSEGTSFELEQWTAAYNDARTNALARLRDAAGEAGARAVIDVHVRRGRFAQARNAVEFVAFGTAVASDRFIPDGEAPIPLVTLDSADFWKLVKSGFWPLGVVGGTSVYYVVSGLRTKSTRLRASRRALQNQEYEDYTEGIGQARLKAAGRLREEARRLAATGVLGIETTREQQSERSDLIVTVDVLGTALTSIDQAGAETVSTSVALDEA
jgi:uncharacterized protein YbjQ (UPF0145 family)